MRNVFLLTVIVLISVSMCSAQNISKDLYEFALDFSSINVKVRGELILFGKYKNDLSLLTYDSYIEKLKKSEMKSNKGISETINEAEKKYFQSKSKTFIVVIYSKRLNAIICDDANTAFVDSIKILNPNERIPDLRSFIK